MENNKKIIVFYISTIGVDPDQMDTFMIKVKERVQPFVNDSDYQILFIPVIGESKVECIDPKYITSKELIKDHERKMAILIEHLNNQINEIKNDDDAR